jgi:hypothetical protein
MNYQIYEAQVDKVSMGQSTNNFKFEESNPPADGPLISGDNCRKQKVSGKRC